MEEKTPDQQGWLVGVYEKSVEGILLCSFSVGSVDHCLASIHVNLYATVLSATLFCVVRSNGLAVVHTENVLELASSNALSLQEVGNSLSTLLRY